MENIIIKNPELLQKKIQIMKKEGKENLHVVSDFDRTLTPMFFNGEKMETGVGQIRAGNYLSPEYVKKSYELKDKYHPIEIDESLSVEERSKKMEEWWTEHLKIMIKYGLNKEVINDIIKKRKIKPREGSLEFYDLLNSFKIPLLIFSAGKGDLIEGFLEEEGKLYNNISVIANFYDYDEKGFVTGYKSKIIHTFNKNEKQTEKHPCYEKIKNRKNVIVIGDSISDLGMIEGLQHENVLSFGFLNENIEVMMEKFQDKFDVVILNDGSMDYVNKILKEIL